MISTLKRRASRIGLSNVKIMVTIDVMELIVPNDESIPNHSMLSVCFERGGKISSTSNKIFNKEELDSLNNNPLQTKIVLKSVVFPIYESVTIIATLYKDVKTGAYQEKTGKIILRQLKKNSMFNSESYKGLALHDLRLDELVNDLQASNVAAGTSHTTHTVERDLAMDLLTGAVLKVIITTNLLNEELEPQDGADNHLTSAMSFMVDDHNLPEDDTIIGATFEDAKGARGVGNKRRKSRMSYMLVSESSLNLATKSLDSADSPPQVKKQSSIGENNKIISHSISNLFNNNDFNDDAEPVTMESPISNSNVRAVTPPPPAAASVVSPPVVPAVVSPAVTSEEQEEEGEEEDEREEEEDSYLRGRASMLNRDDVQLYQNTFKNSSSGGGDKEEEEEEEVILLELAEESSPGPTTNNNNASSAVESTSGGDGTDGGQAAAVREPSEERAIPLDLNLVEFADDKEPAVTTGEKQAATSAAVPSSAKSNKHRTPAKQQRQKKQKKHQPQGDEEDSDTAGSSEEEDLEEGDEEDPSHNELTVASGVAIKKSRKRVKKIAANKEAFRIFTQEIENKTNRIAALELILSQQSQEYQSKLLKLTEQLELVEAENKALRDIVNQVDVVRESIITVQRGYGNNSNSHSYHHIAAVDTQPTTTDVAASLGSVGSGLGGAEGGGVRSVQSSLDDIDLADEYLKRVSVLLAPSIDSTGGAGGAGLMGVGPSVSVDSTGVVTYAMYAKATAEVLSMKDEVQFLKNSLQMAQQAKAEETAAAREAATEAVRANMRRADMQQENEEVLEELIQIKMKVANLAIDYEQQKMLNVTYQRRIQVYAEQLTNMEVQETIRAHSIAPSESPFRNKTNSTMNGKVVSNAAAVVNTSERVLAARRNSAKSLGSMAYPSNNASPGVPTSPSNDPVTVNDKATVMVKL